jgi:ABC-type nitrate/sulfonate/bicarbonate transport system substrate-binding protein
VLLGIIISQASVQAADKIRVAMAADAGHFTVPLAQKKGFLKEEGIEAEIVTISGPVANIALASGEIDYFTGFGAAMRAVIQGQLPARIVVCYRPLPHFVVVSVPDIKSVKDLKGKTFGSSPGGGPDLVARQIIRHFGMDPDKDIKFTRSTNDNATVLPVPRDYQAIKMGFHVLARAEDLFTYPISGLVAHTRKIKEKPDEIKRLIRAGIKANRYMRANRDGTIAILMSTYRLDKEVAAALYDSFAKGFNDDGNLPEDGFRRLIEDTKTVTQIRREVTFNEVSDLSILGEAQKELGIKAK